MLREVLGGGRRLLEEMKTQRSAFSEERKREKGERVEKRKKKGVGGGFSVRLSVCLSVLS